MPGAEGRQRQEPEKEETVERNDLKKILAGVTIAGLVGTGLTTVAFVQPAAAA